MLWFLRPNNGWRTYRGSIRGEVGQKFDLRDSGGDEVYGLRIGILSAGVTAGGLRFKHDGRVDGLRWKGDDGRTGKIVAYRLHKPDGEMQKRAIRRSMFEALRRDAAKLRRVTVLPEKEPS